MSTTILLVEDNLDDAKMTMDALRNANIKNSIIHYQTGDEALAYLYGLYQTAQPQTAQPQTAQPQTAQPQTAQPQTAQPQKNELPGLILLDLNLPGTDGREVLEELKGDPRFKPIPIIVLTTSSDEQDVDLCYAYGANSYVVKPVSFDGFIVAIERLSGYWFEIAVIPKVDLSLIDRGN